MAGDLEILDEQVLATIQRGDKEELRVSLAKARTGAGREVQWHSIRVFWKDEEGKSRPGRAGITIRSKELQTVIDALSGVIVAQEIKAEADENIPF
jgi:hypothetical protein